MITLTLHEDAERKKEILDTKRWLWRYRDAKKNARRIEAEYQELVSIQESVSALNYDGMPKSGAINDLSGMMIARDSILSKAIKASHRATSIYTEIINAIEDLDSVQEKDVMIARYVRLQDNADERDWSTIALSLNYSEQYLYKLHFSALEKITDYRKSRVK